MLCKCGVILILIIAESSNGFRYNDNDAGNILTKTTYTYSSGTLTNGTTYTYTYGNANWGDLLTKYRGTAITYDANGNPLSYHNGSTYTFTWKNGRQLATAATGTYSLSFNYNDEGIRTQKTVNGVTHYYYLSGSRIVAEEWTSNSVTYVCVYLYDAEGAPLGMQYRTSSMGEGEFYTFWFEKNLQGDIVAVYNESGTKLISYSYDAWGRMITTMHNTSGTNYYATYNPFRYRGYYYDSELGLYYLNSRYYDPVTGRFISADGLITTSHNTLTVNQFSYCGNEPIYHCDPFGNREFRCCPNGNCKYCSYSKIDYNTSSYDFSDVFGAYNITSIEGIGKSTVNDLGIMVLTTEVASSGYDIIDGNKGSINVYRNTTSNKVGANMIFSNGSYDIGLGGGCSLFSICKRSRLQF